MIVPVLVWEGGDLTAGKAGYSLLTVIEGRPLQSEGNGPVPWGGLQAEFVERTARKTASAEPSTKDALKLFVSVPSLFQVHPSIDPAP